MNKKILVISLISIMLVASSPVYGLSLNTNKTTGVFDEEILSDGKSAEEIDLTLEDSSAKILTDNSSENKTGFEAGLLRIKTKGKGFKAILPVDIFALSHPISTLQSPGFNPFSVTCFVTLICYNDPNATTKIMTTNGTVIETIKGEHTLVTGILYSMSLFQLGILVNNGLIQGFGLPWLQLPWVVADALLKEVENMLNVSFNFNIVPPAKFLQNIWNNVVPGSPFVDMPNVHDFLVPFQIMPWNNNTSANLFGLIPAWLYFMPWWFSPIICQLFTNALFSSEYAGYSLFAYYNKDPNPKIQEGLDWFENSVANNFKWVYGIYN